MSTIPDRPHGTCECCMKVPADVTIQAPRGEVFQLCLKCACEAMAGAAQTRARRAAEERAREAWRASPEGQAWIAKATYEANICRAVDNPDHPAWKKYPQQVSA